MTSNPYNEALDALRAAAHQLRVAGVGLESVEAERERLAARVVELEAGTPPVVVEPDPPVVVDPPTVPAEPTTPVPTVGAPDYSEFAFASRMPAWTPYARPTEADCDWVLDRPALVARSKRGLGDVTLDATASGWAGTLYRRSRNAGHGPRVTIGVVGYGGEAMLGGFYSGLGNQDVAWQGPTGWAPLDVQIVGLSDDAAITLHWGGSTWAQEFGTTERLGVFDLGLMGERSTHGIVQNKRCGEVLIDGCWMLYPEGHAAGSWNAGMHLANHKRLVVRGLKRRGRKPTDPGAQFQRHALYLKSASEAGSETWVIESDLRGGNQSGVQKRPGRDEAYLGVPADVFVCADNVIDSHGHDHVNADGGAAISLYAGPRSFILRNRARNCRYGALVVSGQPLYNGQERNWYDAEGFAIGEVYVDGNDFGNVGSDRHCVSISNARRVYYGDLNRVQGKLVFDSAWSRSTPAPGNGRVMLVGEFMRFPTPYTYDAAHDAERRMGSTEMAALNVPTWTEALQ